MFLAAFAMIFAVSVSSCGKKKAAAADEAADSCKVEKCEAAAPCCQADSCCATPCDTIKCDKPCGKEECKTACEKKAACDKKVACDKEAACDKKEACKEHKHEGCDHKH